MKKFLLTLTVLLSTYAGLYANNLRINTAPTLVDKDVATGNVKIQFDVTWDNSFRIGTIGTHWDAIWVFAKYQEGGVGPWNHCWMSTNASHHTVGVNNGVAASTQVGTTTISSTPRGMGVFMFRTNNGSGTIDWDQVKLQWNYRDQGISDAASVAVRLYAVEMVYVPQGAFWVGTGGNENGSFTNGSWTSGVTIPLQIASESAISIANTAGNLWGTSNSGNNSIGGTGTLPAAYPKGFNAFYCMKYEVTQGQFRDFLNCLNYTQQNIHLANQFGEAGVQANAAPGTFLFRGATQCRENRNYLKIKVSGTASTVPAIFGCDGDDDGIMDEARDGQNVPMNLTLGFNAAAYLDWSGLRPMSELEFEKAGRGFASPVPEEFAWGTTNWWTAGNGTAKGVLQFADSSAEISTVSPSNFAGLNRSFIRVGAFARATTTREQSGASYFGIMDLIGNAAEMVAAIGISTGILGRNFDGSHGDGQVATNGTGNVSSWTLPQSGASDQFFGQRGGSATGNFDFGVPAVYRLSARSFAAVGPGNDFGRSIGAGFRGVRTAP